MSQLFGVSEEAFLRGIKDVMLTFIDNITLFIQWPKKEHYPQIAQEFDAIGRYENMKGPMLPSRDHKSK